MSQSPSVQVPEMLSTRTHCWGADDSDIIGSTTPLSPEHKALWEARLQHSEDTSWVRWKRRGQLSQRSWGVLAKIL